MATAEAKKNSQLPMAEWLEGDELLPVVQEGQSMAARVRHIRAPLEQRLDALEEEELIKGEWDMTGATVIPYADPARDVGLESIDPQSLEISRFRITSGGVQVYGGAAYMHHQSSNSVVTNTGDLREAWTELVDFGADNSAINVILAVFADEAMTAQDLIDAFFQNPAAAEREFYYFSWMWSPGRTNYSIATRSGAGRTAVGDSLSGNALPVGTPLALRMDWATGRPSIFRQDNATDLLTATNCQLQAPAGTRFRPWAFVMTMGTDGIASMQTVPLQYNLGNSLVSGFIGIGDAVLPDGAQVGDAFVVSAPGNYGGQSAALGNVVMLHPTINDLVVLATDPSQYVTKVDLVGKGYQTADQVQEALAAVAGINRKAILIDYANYVLTAADSGRMVIQRVNGLSPVFDAAQDYPSDWYVFVLNVSPNGVTNPVSMGTLNGAVINGETSFLMEEGNLYIVEHVGGGAFQARVVWRASLERIRSFRRVNTTTGVSPEDYLGTICFEPDTGNDHLNIGDSGSIPYALDFYCSVINRSSAERPFSFINPTNDQLEGEKNAVPPGGVCTLVRHGASLPYKWSLY